MLISVLGIFVFKRVALVQLSCWLLVSILLALPELLKKRKQTAVNELASEQVLLATSQISTSEGNNLTNN
jgi:hypothetical protein